MKTKKKSAVKKVKLVPLDQRRHEYEVAKRDVVTDQLKKSILSYNKTQATRDKLIQRLYNLTIARRARIQKRVQAELARQTEKVQSHDVLKKMGVKLQLPALAKVTLPKYDEAALLAPLSLTPKAPKTAKKTSKGKVRKKAKAAPSPAPEANGEA